MTPLEDDLYDEIARIAAKQKRYWNYQKEFHIHGGLQPAIRLMGLALVAAKEVAGEANPARMASAVVALREFNDDD